MTEPIDHRCAHALTLVSAVRGLLDRYEKVLRIPGVHRQCNVDKPLRSLLQAQHMLAQGWNSGLSNVPEQPPEPPAAPAVAPKVPDSAPQVTEWSAARVHPHSAGLGAIAQRILSE
jgi:hypothetical protein